MPRNLQPLSEITSRVEAKLRNDPKGFRQLIEDAKIKTKSQTQKFDESYEEKQESWLPVKGLTKITTPMISRCRHHLVEFETYHQFACHFFDLMATQQFFEIVELPQKIGAFPERRAVASYTTLASNYELLSFHLMKNPNNPMRRVDEDPRTVNNGKEMSLRYYVSSKNSKPFLEYEAKVMAGLGLWRIAETDQGYEFHHGPCLPAFMVAYWDLVAWAEDQLKAALQGLDESFDQTWFDGMPGFPGFPQPENSR